MQTSIQPRRFKLTKFGIAENPIGSQVCIMIRDRQYLGDVIGRSFNAATGMTMLSVRHFCGAMWPFEVSASAVEVLG